MRSQQIQRGRMTIAGAQAILSHAHITIDAGSYDEIAYNRGGNSTWEVIASYLSGDQAAAVFAALDGSEVDHDTEIGAAATGALTGR